MNFYNYDIMTYYFKRNINQALFQIERTKNKKYLFKFMQITRKINTFEDYDKKFDLQYFFNELYWRKDNIEANFNNLLNYIKSMQLNELYNYLYKEFRRIDNNEFNGLEKIYISTF